MNQTYTQKLALKHLFMFALGLSLAFSAQATKFYVDGNLGDDTRTSLQAQSPGSAWETLTHAISQAAANDSIVVLPGNYSETNIAINKSLSFFGNETGGIPGVGTKPVFNGTSSLFNGSVFILQASKIRIQNFEIHVDQTNTVNGIFSAAGGFNGLVLADNHIFSTRQFVTSVFSSFGVLLGQSTSFAGNDSAVIVRNIIRPLATGRAMFGRGIRMNGGFARIGGTQAADSNQIMGDYGIQVGSASGVMKIQGNRISGRSAAIEINAPAGNRTHFISGNTLSPPSGSPALSLLEIKNNTLTGSVIQVENNVFQNHAFSGIFSTRSRNVQVRNNIFVPSDTARNFIHIVVNTKQQTSSTTELPTSSGITVTGNQFFANSNDGGRGISFQNHFSGANPPFVNVQIGGPGAEANTFGSKLKHFVVLDSASGSSKRLPLWNQASVPASQMRPVEIDLDLSQNLYDVGLGAQLPNNMANPQLMALEDRLLHQIDFDSLGFLTVVPNAAFVTSTSFISPKTTEPSLKRAVDVIGSDDWTIYAEPIAYNDNITLSNSLVLNAEPNGQITLANLALNGAGKVLSANSALRLTGGLSLLSGNIDLADGDLRLASGAAITGGNNGSYIQTKGTGKLILENLASVAEFPIGIASGYRPVQILNSGAADDFGLRIQPDVLSSGLTGTPVDSVVGYTLVLNEGSLNGASSIRLRTFWEGSDEKAGFSRNSVSLQAFFAGSWVNLTGNTAISANGSDPYTAAFDNLTSGFPNLPLRIRNFTASGNLYYVDQANGDDNRSANEAKVPTTAWKTIGKALATVNDGDSVQVFAGNYPENNLNISKAIHLFGNVVGIGTGVGAGTGVRPVVNGTALGSDSTIFRISSPNVWIQNFQMEVDQNLVIHGIVSKTTGYNNLRVFDNRILSVRTNPGPVTFPCQRFNTYGIRLGGFGTDSFTIQRNEISPAAIDGSVCFFGRGIKLFGGHGLIGGPLPADSNRILAYYSIQTGDADGGLVQIRNNFLLGIGVQVVAPAANSGIHLVEANRFVLAFPQFFPTQCEIKDIQKAGTGLAVRNNIFAGFSNSAVFVQRSQFVRIESNQFIPVDTAASFRAVVVNTKQETTSSNQPPVPSGAVIKGNIFRAGALPNAGTAIEFGNHNDDPNSTTAFSGVEIGGPGAEANTFEGRLKNVLVLDPLSGPSNQVFFWGIYPVTTMAPVQDNFDLKENLMEVASGTKRPVDMTVAELYQIENKIQHGLDISGLGFATVRDNQAFVTNQSFQTPFSTAPSLQRANDVASDGFTIFVQPDQIAETATLRHNLILDAQPSTGFTLTGLRLNGSGKVVSTADSIRLTDTLDLVAGNLDLGAGSLVLSEDIVVSGGSSSSFVRTLATGQVVHLNIGSAEKIFPVGTGTTYTPLAFSNSGTSDVYGVRLQDGVFDSGTPLDTVVGVTWILNEGTIGGSNLQARFGWPGSKERPGFDRNNAFVDQLILNWETISGVTPLVSTGSDPFEVGANLQSSFSFAPLRVSSLFKAPVVGGTLYYVDDNTGDDGRSNLAATNPITPWKTIGKALASISDGDSVQVFEGTYNEAGLQVTKSVQLFGSVAGIGTGPGAGTGIRPIVNGSVGGSDSAIFSVRSPGVQINNFQIEANQGTIAHGIYGRNGNFNNLRILNCHVYSTGVSAIPGLPCVQFQTFGMRFLNGGTDSVIIKGCFIQPKSLNNNCAFGRGIRTFSGGRFIIGGPAALDSNRIIGLYCVQMGDLGGQSRIENNAMAGQGVEITAPEANSGTHEVLGNRIFPVIPQIFLSLIELKDVQKAGTGVRVEGNVLNGHSNIGVFSERSRNILVRNNIFIPSDTAKNYRHVSVNTKQQTTASNQPPGINSITVQGNEFRSGSASGGVGFELANHNDDPNSSVAFQSIVLGGTGADANTFGPNLQLFVRLDPSSGSSGTIPPWTTYPVTTMKPVADVFDLNENLYTVSGGVKRPASMTDTEFFELEDKVLHGIDYDSLGFLVWKNNHAFVSNSSFVEPFTSVPSIQRAAKVTGTTDGWTINIQPSQLSEVVSVTKAMTWNTFPADSMRLGGIAMNAPDKVLTLADRFVLTTSLDVSSPTGGKIDIGDNDLVVLPATIVSQGTSGSYVSTSGTGDFVHRNVNDQAKFFPVGTPDSYAPVEFDDANNSGDNIKVKVNPAPTSGDFTPPLPGTISTFAKFQWEICEDVTGGSNAVLRFDWVDPLNISGGGTINGIGQFDGLAWNTKLANIGPGLVASASEFTSFCAPFALVGDPTLTNITTQPVIKVFSGVLDRYCLGDSIKIPFTVNGTGILPGNQFNAFLSNPDGTFPGTGGTQIGSVLGNGSDTIRTRIPATLIPGLNYRIRVVSTNPVITGIATVDSIKVFSLPARPVITGDSALCTGETTTLTSTISDNYLWTPGNSTGQTLSVNAAGAYQVQITDLNGCVNRSAIRNVSLLPNPVAEAITSNGSLIRCAGDSVVLTANPDGLSYTWLNTTPLVTTRNLTVKASGSFQVIVSNANGCSDTSAAVVTTFNALPAKPVITIPNDTVCQPTALQFETPAGFTYDWSITGISPNPTTATVAVTAPGAYSATVNITDGNGCRNTSDPVNGLVKRQPIAPVITPLQGDVSVCEGDTIRLQGQPFAAATNYTWLPSNIQVSTLVISAPGLQTINLNVDSAGCTNSAANALTININGRPTKPVVQITSGTTSFCQGDSIVLTSTAGTSYNWSPGNLSGQSIVVKTTGDYSVVVLNDSACPSIPSDVLAISVRKNPEVPQISASQTTFCFGATATLSISNPGTNNLYTWQPAGTGNSITVSASGNYTVRADSSNNCFSISQPVTITVNPLPEPVIASSDPDLQICQGDSVVLTSNSVTGNLWGGVPNAPTGPRIVVRTSTPAITLRLTDANGCFAVAGPVSVQVDTLPKVKLLEDTALVVRDEYTIRATQGPSNAATFEWFKGAVALGQTTGNQPSFNITAQNTDVYSVLLTDSNGCQTSDSILVRVSNEIFVPNSFSPNKDGKNDRFKVYGFGVQTIEVKVFDRLGNVVYETNRVEDIVETDEDQDTVPGWDGNYKGKPASQESYIWSVKGTFQTGEPIRVTGGHLSGSVILLN